MSNFDVANCLVALGGDKGNTVPKYNVTAAEIAVLQTIHGAEAVIEIVPVREIAGNHRAERERLLAKYPAKDGQNRQIVDRMFPGAAARVFERLNELQLGADQFKRGHVPVWLSEQPEEPTVQAVDESAQAYLASLEGQAQGQPDLDDLDSDDDLAADLAADPAADQAGGEGRDEVGGAGALS